MNACDTPASQGHLNPEASPPVARYAPAADLADLVRHHWVPEWALPEGRSVIARVLGYPALNLVVDARGVVVSGATRGASARVLHGRGWAVGTLLQPAATLALGLDAASLLDDIQSLAEPALRDDVVAAMESAAPTPPRHHAAVEVVAGWLRKQAAPVCDQGLLANEAVALVEAELSLTRVADLASRLGVTPRTLQRAVRRCTGLSPQQVIRRRRLHEVADRLRRGSGEHLAGLAAETGYADHAHLTREFTRAVHESPSSFRERS